MGRFVYDRSSRQSVNILKSDKHCKGDFGIMWELALCKDQFPPTNNQLRTSSNSRTHATVHDGHIVTEPIQRKAPAKEKECVRMLDAEAFLADVVDEGPNADVAFHANLSSTSATNSKSMRNAQEEHLDSAAETEMMTIRSVIIMYLLDYRAQNVPTETGKSPVISETKADTELVQENDLLKSTLSGKEKSIAFLQSEKEKILSEKKDLADSYLDEIVCLKNANKVARDILQRFNMPTETIPMLFKKPKMATADLHKETS
ncbi:hypothetical protein Tco_0093162 [Tanacetum coccineum]